MDEDPTETGAGRPATPEAPAVPPSPPAPPEAGPAAPPSGAGAASPPSSPPPPYAPIPPSARPGPAPGFEYASFGGRLIAYVIDAIVVGLVTGIVAIVMGGGLIGLWRLGALGLGSPGFDIGFGRVAFAIVGGLISGAYFVYFWTQTGATPGQSFLGLEVRNAADGSRLTQDQAIRRWAFLIVPFVSVIPLVGILVFLYQVFLAYTVTTDPAFQGFHDKQAGTVVIRRAA